MISGQLYDPLGFVFHPLDGPQVGPWTCVASRPELPLAVVGGAGGRAVLVSAAGAVHEQTAASGDFRAAAVDRAGSVYLATDREIWFRSSEGLWTRASGDEQPPAPYLALFADAGRVVAVAEDGSVVEGRA
ncbi:MAG: hypothetical protein IT374_04145 [Polyangiaceae bacterium]|nr:hypothetical protein [Polyangiaceae bacterium]